MIERIQHAGLELALVLRRGFHRDGIEFLTPGSADLQLGYMNRPTGYVIDAHLHNPVRREVHTTSEVLVIRSGRARIDFYDNDRLYLESIVLDAGDIVLFLGGGHGLQMLEPTEIVEVKQGPYSGEREKTRFDGIPPERVRFRGVAG